MFVATPGRRSMRFRRPRGADRPTGHRLRPPDTGATSGVRGESLDAGGPTCLLQLDFCSVLLEIEYLAVVVHAHADSGPHEGIWSLERQSLAFVAHKNIGDSRVIVLYSHLTPGGVELQHSPVTEVIWIEDFP